jgi:hypothetical protein
MTTTQNNASGIRIALWSAQIILALAFGMAGVMKLTTPLQELLSSMPSLAGMGWLVRFIGLSELAAAIGLILPALTRIAPILTPVAASGLLVIMVLAAGLHLLRAEFSALPIVAALAALTYFVAWGRFKRAPIASRSSMSLQRARAH